MIDPSRTALLVVLAALAGGGATWFLLARRPAEAPPAAPPPAPPPSAAPATPVAVPQPYAPSRPEAGKKGMLLPDGSEVAPLNGVTDPPALVWNNPEWSPIVRQERNGGIDWYVHADGSYSTTQWIWRSDLGRYDAMSYSLHPRAPAPIDPGALEAELRRR